jgi:putative redox protein
MKKTRIDCEWKDGMSFESELNGFKLTIDAAPEVGGKNQGPRPKPLLLLALAGCTGMDVISILKKMRVTPEYFNIHVEAVNTEEHPKTYSSFHIVYQFRGEDIPLDKIEKAVVLSQDKYCGVSDLLKKGAEITHEIKILD